MEGVPERNMQLAEAMPEHEEMYSKESVAAAAAEILEDRLAMQAVPETLDEAFHHVAKLEAIADAITDPADRHVLKAAGIALSEAFSAMPHGQFVAYQKLKMEQRIYGAHNEALESQTAPM